MQFSASIARLLSAAAAVRSLRSQMFPSHADRFDITLYQLLLPSDYDANSQCAKANEEDRQVISRDLSRTP